MLRNKTRRMSESRFSSTPSLSCWETQVGIGLNAQQQLGENSPFADFGRLGVGSSEVTLADAGAQASVGVTISAPLRYNELAPRFSKDLLGLDFVWSRPCSAAQLVYHEANTPSKSRTRCHSRPPFGCNPICRSSGIQPSTRIPAPPSSGNSNSTPHGEHR